MKTNSLDFDAQALREKILDLAMRGKLVPQDPNDESASVLLEKIKAEKAELIKEKKIKKTKPLPPITDDEKPFDIPDSWEWVRLGDVGNWAAGATPSRKHPEYYGGNIPWLKTGDLNDDVVEDTTEKITKLGVENSSVKINKPGNVLIAMYGATIGKLGIVGNKELVTNQACCGCTPFNGVYNWYLFYYLFASRKRLIDLGSGGAQPNISKQKIENFSFPLPPLSEQSRIAAKIAQLFALLRKVESSTQQYAKLQTLLKSKVLDLAMRGKLVKQDPNDEPASELLKKIKAEKAELIKEKKIKKTKPLPPITDDEKPFDIPDSWEWVRLGDLTAPVEYAMADGPFGSNLKKTDYTLDPEVRIIQLSNIGENGWKDQNVKYTTFEHLKSIQRSEVFPGNIVIAKMMPAGRAIIVPNKDKKYVLSSDAVKFIPDTHIYKDFLIYAINSNTYRDQVNEKLQGTTRPRTSLKKLKNFLIPLPPFDEQKRIVTKTFDLFNMIG
ncbi:restriction endonuclease subunit S [Lactobacillus amylovorus]|uniref:restriction endonuclease subunit S n=1 Tax=Lactobacillus amylovorus TaxID=1604 RepID=UPI003F93720A